MSSFGKDPSQLGRVQNFRNQAQHYEKSKAHSGGGSKFGPPTWLNKFNPSYDDPDEIRVVRGDYEVLVGLQDATVDKQVLPYFPFVEHFHGGLKKGSVCSAGPLGSFKDKRDPCIACDLYWAERSANRGTKKQGAVSRRDMYSFSVLHFAPYAYIEQVDRETLKIREDSEGKAYMAWERILPNEVNHPKFQGKERRDAHMLHWDIGFGHWNTLLAYDKEIGKSCRACGGRNTIKTEAWLCPACGEALIEPGNTTYTPQEVEQLTTDDVTCAHCHQVIRMNELISCRGCAQGVRADIFDVNMSVKRVKDPKGGNQSTLMVTGWSDPCGIDQRFTDIAKPLDLKKIFTPTSIELQSEIYRTGPGAPAPVAASGRTPITVGQHSRPFSK